MNARTHPWTSQSSGNVCFAQRTRRSFSILFYFPSLSQASPSPKELQDGKQADPQNIRKDQALSNSFPIPLLALKISKI